MRLLAEEIISGLYSKDYRGEIGAIYHFVLGHVRYANDPRTVELVKRPEHVIREIIAGRIPSLDCFPKGTLLLDRNYRFVPVEEIQPGQKIWGRDRWSEVQATAYKGICTVDTIFLNNGSQITVTPEHKVYVRSCGHHHQGAPCHKNCFQKSDNYVRVPVSELNSGMVLLTPDRIPFGEQEQDPRRSLIEGLYLSDGWHQKSSFAISGQDGQPKEEQKKTVQAICESLGVNTTWYRKSIHVRDAEWTLRCQLMGSRAPEKHALEIGLREGAASALLEGILADSGKNTNGNGRTLTSTSHQLFLQTRVLLKMQGLACSERFIRNHGGLGINPIYRLGIRESEKALRVKSVERSVAEVPVYDIQTDDHYVYLPEADTTVSNCDDLATFLAALYLSVGRRVRIVTVAFKKIVFNGEIQYSHVFVQVQEPRTRVWINTDPVAAEDTAKMLREVQAIKFWPVA